MKSRIEHRDKSLNPTTKITNQVMTSRKKYLSNEPKVKNK